jgi:membrane protein required for colicin V production
MNWIDIGIIALLLYQMAMGYRKRLSRSVLDLIGIVAVVIITLTQFRLVSDLLGEILSSSSALIRWLSFFICLGLSMALINGMMLLVSRFIKTSSPTWLDRVIGLLLGGTRGTIIASVFLILYVSLPISTPFTSQIAQSSLAPSALSIIPLVYDTVVPRIKPDSRPFVEQLEFYFRSNKTVDTAFMTASTDKFGQLLNRLFKPPLEGRAFGPP